VIAYGAGWTDAARQQPVGDTGATRPAMSTRSSPPSSERALGDPDPLRGVAQLVARWGAAFVLAPDGVTRTKALGAEHMARKLRDALPGGDQPVRAALWTFLRPILSPRLTALNRDAFVPDARDRVHRRPRRADADLDELDFGEDSAEAA
jgi:hypothetical protein